MTLTALITFALDRHRSSRALPNLEKLLMPGELSSAHAKLEDNCSSCHDRSDRSRQTALCLDCHKDVAADVARQGRHARPAAQHRQRRVQGLPQRTSRSQDRHRQAGARSVRSSQHGLPPRRRAQRARLRLVSRAGKPFRDGQLELRQLPQDSRRASRVRSAPIAAPATRTSSWRGARFDHDKTHFPLHGAHREHAPAPPATSPADTRTRRGAAAPATRRTTCIAARAARTAPSATPNPAGRPRNSITRRRPASRCSAGTARSTAPAAIAVAGSKMNCRRPASAAIAPPTAHASRFGEDCASCHGNDAWRPAPFDHAQKAKFALLGSHAKLDCHACHTGRAATQKLPTDCAGCHRGDDVHGGAHESRLRQLPRQRRLARRTCASTTTSATSPC